MTKIGILGATGNVGSGIVRLLADTTDVVAISRRGGRDTPRVRHVAADLTQPEQLRDALRTVDAVFVIATALRSVGRAQRAGVPLIAQRSEIVARLEGLSTCDGRMPKCSRAAADKCADDANPAACAAVVSDAPSAYARATWNARSHRR